MCHVPLHVPFIPQVLWLSDNYIPAIEGLKTLTKLRELNLARNDITAVGESLSSNINLDTLNLADNIVGNFKVGGEGRPPVNFIFHDAWNCHFTVTPEMEPNQQTNMP